MILQGGSLCSKIFVAIFCDPHGDWDILLCATDGARSLHESRTGALCREPGETASGYTIASEVKSTLDQLLANPTVTQGLNFKSDQDNRIAEQIAITEIPASPFNEDERAKIRPAVY